MRVSLNWLKHYITLSAHDTGLASRLTMAGLEVESVESQSDNLRGIVVGEVRGIEPHPNARKLTVCRVYDGKNEVQVVCGAPNVSRGQKVAFAPEGSTVPRDQHDPDGAPFEIGRVNLRGVESAGMICSGYELGISDDREGILVLATGAKPGTPLSRFLGREDTVFEIGVTANRPDLLSHIGVAREIAAMTGKHLKLPRISVREGRKTCAGALTVNILHPGDCPRYSARVVEGIHVGPSPSRIQDALISVGIRPVNNVVDITNYVLMEIGQPLHAFDYDKLSGGTIIVRRGETGRKFETLDGKQREIGADTLLICDEAEPVAIAGVMGGRNSEISGETRSVVIESAYFDPASIRRTSKRLGVSTEASQRFERGADPNITVWALDRAAELLARVAGGTVLKGRIDAYPRKIRERRVPFNVGNSDKLLGVAIRPEKISIFFKRIGIKQIGRWKNGTARFLVPTWRPDLTREIDLVEEAARLHGYDRIGTSARITLDIGEWRRDTALTDLPDRVREHLSAAGFREIVTNSMSDGDTAGLAGLPPVAIANPLSREMGALRTSLLPGLLTTVKYNIFHGTESSRFYEIGSVFWRIQGTDPESLEGYHEEERLMLALYGLESPPYWEEKPKKSTIFTLKGEANALLGKFSLDNPRYIPYSTSTALSERSIFIEIKGEKVGSLGTVSQNLLKRFDIGTEVHYLDLSLEALRKIGGEGSKFRHYPKFPMVRRDIAVIVRENVPIGVIEGQIRRAAGPMLRELALFDIFRGDQVGQGNKSCAFSLGLQSGKGTLGQEEIVGLMDAVTKQLKSSLGAELRQ